MAHMSSLMEQKVELEHLPLHYMRVNSFLTGQRLADTGGLTCGPGDTNSNQLPHEEPVMELD